MNRSARPIATQWTLLGLALLALSSVPLQAQGVAAGLQEYFVLGHEQHVWDLMDKVQNGEGGAQFVDGMNSVVTATANADGQVIYYDHWEDGFEADIFNPVQASTIVLGDGMAANGDVCDFNPRVCSPTSDTLMRGEFVNLRSDEGFIPPNGCAEPSVPGFPELCSSVPVNPRCAVAGACTAAEIRFDGGDLIQTTGGPLSVIHSQDPLNNFIGGSTEILSFEAVQNAFGYSIPVGEDLYVANTITEPFHYVDLNLVAFQDGTDIFVTSPGAGTVSFTLNRGEHWTSLGFIDDNAFNPSLFLTVNAGTKISTTKPIAGLLFTGGDGTWATRHYALIPDVLHSTDYITTAPGDDPAVGPSVANRPGAIYIFNPDPIPSIDVQVTELIGGVPTTVTVNVPPNGTIARPIPVDSTIRMTSDRSFWGISAYDYDTNISDWGHSWLATKFLTTNYTVSYAPGDFTDPPATSLSPVYIAPTEDLTRILVDFDNDGLFDEVDTDGDGFLNPGIADPACDPVTPNCAYVVNSLAALSVFDPSDDDNTGTRVVANKPVALAWGQETDLTGFGDTALDTGFTVYPPLFVDTVLEIEKSVTPTILGTAGGVATYTLTLTSGDFGPLTAVEVYDLLPPGVAGVDYVPGSTLVTYPDLTQDTSDPVASIDPGTGRDRLDWTLSPDTMGALQTLTVRYQVNIPAAPGGTPRTLINEGRGVGVLGQSIFFPFDQAAVTQSDVLITKSVNAATAQVGDVLTYTLAVTNNGVAAETVVRIADVIPPNTTYCDTTTPGLGACNDPTGQGPFTPVVPGFQPASNSVIWTTASFSPGGPHLLTFDVVINDGTPVGSMIQNQGSYESTQTPFHFSNQVETLTLGPELTTEKSRFPVPNPLPGPPLHPNEFQTFEILVHNISAVSATNVLIRDPFFPNATYVPGSMRWRLNADPLVAVTDAADADAGTLIPGARLELLVPVLGPGEDITFRFQVRVDPGTDGLFVNNQATVLSDQTLAIDTNLIQIPIVGDSTVTGHVFLDLDGNGVQDPGEPDLANVDVMVTDSTGLTQTVSTDANGDYLVTVDRACYEDELPAVAYGGSQGMLDWSADSWTEFGTGADALPTTLPMRVFADPLAVFGNSLEINGGPAAGNRGFTRAVDLSAGAGFTAGFASIDINFRRVSMEGTDNVQLDIDYDNDGTFNDVLGTFVGGVGDDLTWQTASFALDSGQLPDDPVVFRFLGTGFNSTTDEFWIDNVSVCNNAVTADVRDTDPDIPQGATLSTGNDPQTVALVSGGSVATADVGFQPPPLQFTKDSDPVGHQVLEGQTITYTLNVTNTSGVTQTGIDISDPVPTGTTPVMGSTVVTVSDPVLRVTEYFVASGSFTGTVFDLTLNQALVADYFVIAQGSDGDETGGGDRGPDENYVSLTQDPFGTGGLGTSAGATTLRLERNGAVDSWVGVVTVVECLADCAADGFTLLDVQRVAHTGTGTSGSVASSTAWADINQVQLVGGFNGAGCDTAEASVVNTKVCHVRLFPSGTDQINWTRDGGGGATLSTATSTVMVVDWGSAWTVQRTRILGSNGGDGADAVGEYNTSAISSVARANTWVWGTGHTSDNGIGDAGESVLLTLGDGVNQLANETLVAAGQETAGDTIDFEVWALTHPDLTVTSAFKADGDAGNLIVDVAVPVAGSPRMALAYNGQNGVGTAYPRPMFSARYFADDTVRLERRRSGQDFPAWVQGIDLSGVLTSTVSAGNDPPGLVLAGDGYSLAPGQTMTVTFQVVVDDPAAPAVTQIDNTATLNTDLEGPIQASISDALLRLDVLVEPNNAGFAVPGGTVTYTHFVTNTGQDDDSYDLTSVSELGYRVDLIDPATGTIIATDTNGDGVWDGGVTINTGTLASGESAEYRLRVHVPLGTPLGTEESTVLRATSDFTTAVTDFATDETTVVDALDNGPVELVPDHSGIVVPGGSIAYTHTVTNNTGVSDTFDLTAFPTLPGWTATIYNDSNGDGVYTPGVDVAIMNTLLLSDGQLQTIFVVVDAPVGAMAGDEDVVHITAISRNDPALFDGATDTTTIAPPQDLDLSGGGTRHANPGETLIFPGTIKNKTGVSDRFDFTITPSAFNGLDGLNHPSQLWVDTTMNGIPDTQIAEDADGDGTWDTILAGFDTDMDGNPDVAVPAQGEVAYSLRRPIPGTMGSSRDPVTLTATSQNNGLEDSVTATTIIAAATHALISEVRAYAQGGQVVVEWTTSLEVGTIGFEVFSSRPGEATLRKVQTRSVPSLLGSQHGATYRVADPGAQPGQSLQYWIVEEDRRGVHRAFGPYAVVAGEDTRHTPVLTDWFDEEPNLSPWRPSPVTGDGPEGVLPADRAKVRVAEDTLVFVSVADLADALSQSVASVTSWLEGGDMSVHLGTAPPTGPCTPQPPGAGGIFSDGFESGDLCAWSSQQGFVPGTGAIAWLPAPDSSGLYFWGVGVTDSIYTDERVYYVEHAPGLTMGKADGASPAAAPGQSFPETLHFEDEQFPVTSVFTDPEADFWVWEYFTGGDPTFGIRDFPLEVPDPRSDVASTVAIFLQGETDDPDVTLDHRTIGRLNGQSQQLNWGGATAAQLDISLNPGDLIDGTNTVQIEAQLVPGVTNDLTYLEAIEISYARHYRAVADRLLAPTAGHSVLTIEGLTRSDVQVFDLSNPRQPAVVNGLTVEPDGGGFRVSFEPPAGGPYLVQPLDTAVQIAPVGDLAPDLVSSANRGEYVVIAAAGLEAGAEALASYRASQGLEARVVTVDDVYDDFSQGVATPWAIRSFLRHATDNWDLAPAWVVLVGDSAFDYKDRWGTGENMIPSPMGSTPDGLFTADNRLGDLTGGDGVPEVGLGRLPVHTPGELAAYLAKLMAFESASLGGWKGQTVWIADDADEGGEFADDSDALQLWVPPSLTRQRIYVDDLGVGPARTASLAAIDAGAQLVNFVGHAGLDRLATEGLVVSADVASFTNDDRAPILTAVSCALARFDLPGFDTLSETMLSAANGGSIAVWSPSGLAMGLETKAIGERFLARGLGATGVRLGDAARQALADYLATPDAEGYLPAVFTLLGDPAVEIEH